MKKFKRAAPMILALSLVLCILGGCAPSGTGASTTAPSAPPSTTAAQGTTAAATTAAPAKTFNWSLATSSSGSSPYTLGSIISNVINENQKSVTLSAQVTAGFNENLNLVVDGDANVGLGTCLDLSQAYTQTKGFEDAKFKDIRRISLYSIEFGHQVVRADSGIKTLNDLIGKKLNINTPSSVTATRNRMIIQGMGRTADDFKIFEIATSGAMNGLRDKTFDATFNGMSIGNAAVMELASQIPVNLIDIPQDVFEKFNQAAGGAFGYGVIPANTYKGQEQDCHTWIGYNMLYCKADADDDAIYEITKAFWENLDELAAADKGFAALNLDMITFGPDVPLHPGAERYLKEAGYIK